MTLSRLSQFTDLDVAVVGDLVVDHYLYAEPRRLSREAPVMVLRHVHDRFGAGGAANVARNLRALGCRVRVLGVVGRDDSGRKLLELLEADSIDTSAVVTLDGGFGTATKTRVLAAEPRRKLQQVLRIDRESAHPIEPAVRAAIAGDLAAAAGSVDAVVVSDYGYGVASAEVGLAVGHLAATGTTVVLDPRDDVRHLRGLTAATPNIDELARCTGIAADRLDDRDELAAAASALLQLAGCRFLLVTRGNLGMAVFGEGLPIGGILVDASGTGEITDVCGAGDTAAAVFTAALAAGAGAPEAMHIANTAAGVVVLEHGASVCRIEALEAALAVPPASPAPAGHRS